MRGGAALREPDPLPRRVVEPHRALHRDRARRADRPFFPGLRDLEHHLGGPLERAPVRLDGPVSWGPWRLRPNRDGLWVRSWRAGDRLASRGKKIQDLFVDAKVPRSEREAWPLVVKGDEVVVVPGIATAPGWEDAVGEERE